MPSLLRATGFRACRRGRHYENQRSRLAHRRTLAHGAWGAIRRSRTECGINVHKHGSVHLPGLPSRL
eukprot:2580759-Pleurochrysis_carterae.AAC.1